MVSESDGSRWADFDLGDRSAATFCRRYKRLPETGLYRTDAYRVYGWLPADRHQVGKGGAVNWNEGLLSWCRGRLPAASSYEGLHEKRGDAGVFAGYGPGGLAREILCQFMLRIPAAACTARAASIPASRHSPPRACTAIPPPEPPFPLVLVICMLHLPSG